MVDGNLEWIQPILILVTLGIVIMLTLRQASELRKLQESANIRPKIITVIDCNGERRERDFKEGDYVGLSTSECSGGSEGVIVGIYAIEQAPPKKKK
ncbi:MAG: hypothetical protein GSR85_04125 [Desulfurococcales archaeon]|nr:hypothetical protein [Desulfurococcales archaeon]